MFLAESGSPVTIIIRGPDLNANMSRYLLERIEEDPRSLHLMATTHFAPFTSQRPTANTR